MMKKRQKQLSTAELWDDSALLRSWEDALSEYKRYHSIHARGERVEDVLKEFEEKEKAKAKAEAGSGELVVNGSGSIRSSGSGQTDEAPAEDLEDGEVESETEGQMPASHILPLAQPPHENRLDEQDAVKQPDTLSNMPQMSFPGVKDEALRNLMMSWYYAGYYTGLYEGQQQQSRNSTRSDATKGLDSAN